MSIENDKNYKQCRGGKISCGQWKDLSEFDFRKDTGKYRGQCKSCRKEAQHLHYIENKEEISARTNLYYLENKDKVRKSQKDYRENHKDEIKVKRHIFYENNKEEINKKNREYYKENKIAHSNYDKEYRKKNLLSIREKDKQRRKDNPEKFKLKNKRYYDKNKSTIIVKQSTYVQQNRDKVNKRTRKWRKARRQNDPSFRLRDSVSAAIFIALKSNGGSKHGQSMTKYLEYSFQELKEHIEKLFSHPDNLTADGQVWMTWENWGKYDHETWNDNDPTTWKWQLDHIIPHSTFRYISMDSDEFRQCWALSNLRPLSAKQNYLDGVRKTRHPKA